MAALNGPSSKLWSFFSLFFFFCWLNLVHQRLKRTLCKINSLIMWPTD